ncbi:hypothetical protein N0V84_009728 [Fusarium piperis]|uniref:Uncharacterized protein n=1 Tax=Fusarium piperis TaxID=1435070 RepID=A0A9W8W5S0_9HYPO|nr:hypothetical protein N0V84_009728 [Fusarium piperis]
MAPQDATAAVLAWIPEAETPKTLTIAFATSQREEAKRTVIAIKARILSTKRHYNPEIRQLQKEKEDMVKALKKQLRTRSKTSAERSEGHRGNMKG